VGGLVEDIDRSGWDASIDVNIRGVVNTVLPAYERMRDQGSGSIVLLGSLAGLAGTPLLTPYAMTKSAIVGLAASLRPEAARHGVGVTVVCPGPVETPLLDTAGPTPGMSVRRYLVASAGPPLDPADLADSVVAAVRKDRARVIPGRAKLLWRLSRFAPNLTDREIAKGMHEEIAAAQG
jgi:short-subunit dehydrogenase